MNHFSGGSVAVFCVIIPLLFQESTQLGWDDIDDKLQKFKDEILSEVRGLESRLNYQIERVDSLLKSKDDAIGKNTDDIGEMLTDIRKNTDDIRKLEIDLRKIRDMRDGGLIVTTVRQVKNMVLQGNTPTAAGTKGEKGDTGLQGPRGYPGQKGERGPMPRGFQTSGVPGPKGDRGEKGEIGPRGYRGDIGPRGYKGNTGVFDGQTGVSVIQESCKQQLLAGECADYVLKWGYDPTQSACVQFWWGGCGGNENRYDDEVQCKQACMAQRGFPAGWMKGEKGERGAQGLTGGPGPTGLKGERGIQGYPGSRGPIGPKGLDGIRGLPRLRGQPGPVGPVGPRGPKGQSGQDGRRGRQGTKGQKGLQGPMGPKGLRGLQGVRGSDGPMGSRGPEGRRGSSGSKGQKGSRGYMGPKGPTGLRGTQGTRGPPGRVGSMGPPGRQGRKGTPGLSYDYSNCRRLYERGQRQSGVYQITPTVGTSFRVYCDMTTEGGGWTRIQRRRGVYGATAQSPGEITVTSSTLNFARNWQEYKDGFSRGEELWLGNEKIYQLLQSSNKKWSLRIDVYHSSETRAPNEHKKLYMRNFKIDSESNKYRLTYDAFNRTRTCGARIERNNNMSFSTWDRDNDRQSGSCSRLWGSSGWWYNNCFVINLNAMNWWAYSYMYPHCQRYNYLSGSDMLIRPDN